MKTILELVKSMLLGGLFVLLPLLLLYLMISEAVELVIALAIPEVLNRVGPMIECHGPRR